MHTIIYTCWLAISCLACITSTGSMQDLSNQTPVFPAFDWQGHRGCRGLLPENTLPAMFKAIDLGVTTLEMDVCIARDGTPVLSHEPFFHDEITTLPNGQTIPAGDESYLLYQMSMDSIRQFDVGKKAHPRFPQQVATAAVKPSLAEVLEKTQAYAREKGKNIWYNIETKSQASTDFIRHPPPAEFVRLLMNVIKHAGLSNQVVIQSFDMRTLQVLQAQYPTVKLALLIEGDDPRSLHKQMADLGFQPFIYSPEFSRVNPALIADCHRLGMKVIPWTVNQVAVMKMLKSMGVDGLISDYPNLYNSLQ
jgi:glycerophosphoryl diester phosphodiesterase